MVIVYLIFDNFYRQKELILKDKKQQDRLMLLPIHKMLRLGRNYDDKYLNNVIMKNLNTAKEFDYENMSVMVTPESYMKVIEVVKKICKKMEKENISPDNMP